MHGSRSAAIFPMIAAGGHEGPFEADLVFPAQQETRNPMACLMMPKTGSTVCFRRPSSCLPFALSNQCAKRSLNDGAGHGEGGDLMEGIGEQVFVFAPEFADRVVIGLDVTDGNQQASLMEGGVSQSMLT
jgi:hypothetical protein